MIVVYEASTGHKVKLVLESLREIIWVAPANQHLNARAALWSSASFESFFKQFSELPKECRAGVGG